jgi:hypothetical protein
LNESGSKIGSHEKIRPFKDPSHEAKNGKTTQGGRSQIRLGHFGNIWALPLVERSLSPPGQKAFFRHFYDI